jgi:hypothetical protein
MVCMKAVTVYGVVISGPYEFKFVLELVKCPLVGTVLSDRTTFAWERFCVKFSAVLP